MPDSMMDMEHRDHQLHRQQQPQRVSTTVSGSGVGAIGAPSGIGLDASSSNFATPTTEHRDRDHLQQQPLQPLQQQQQQQPPPPPQQQQGPPHIECDYQQHNHNHNQHQQQQQQPQQPQQPPPQTLPHAHHALSQQSHQQQAIHRAEQRRADEEISDKASTCGKLLIFLSVALVVLTLPFSLFVCFKVVQEYERAVIFRLGRLMQGGAKGPGIFFILPCIDSYARVDLRTRTYDVPPQEFVTYVKRMKATVEMPQNRKP